MRAAAVMVSIGLSIGLALLPQLSPAQTDCGRPVVGGDPWPVAAPESVELSSATICPMVKWLGESKQRNVHAVLVARHGKRWVDWAVGIGWGGVPAGCTSICPMNLLCASLRKPNRG